MGLITYSGVFADVSRAVHEKCLLCDLLSKFAKNSDTCIIYVGSAGRKTGECTDENELVSVLLYFSR